MKFIHRELTGVKLALIGCTSAASSSICEATRNNTAVVVGVYLLVHKAEINFVCRVRPRVCRRMYLTVKILHMGFKVKF